jgi:hypothetical protein
MFASSECKNCASCQLPILYVASLPGERLVLRHNEQSLFPTGPATNKWATTQVTKKMVYKYYHARSQCVFRRFRRTYFEHMPVRLGARVRQELQRHPLDFSHRDID